MKLFLLLVIPLLAFNLIPSRPMNNYSFWVDNRFSPKQLQMIREGIDLWANNNGKRTNIAAVTRLDKVVNGDGIPMIVSSESVSVATTIVNSQFADDLLFHITDADITLNTVVLGNTNQFFNAFLHELGHAQGLYHNAIKGSIMNVTIYFDANTSKASPIDPKYGLHIDDIFACYYARHTLKYEKLSRSDVNRVEYRS